MLCSVCDGKGFIGKICPECEGNPDEIGDTGCSTCEGDGYIEIPCEACNETGEECNEPFDDEMDEENMLCPNCGSISFDDQDLMTILEQEFDEQTVE